MKVAALLILLFALPALAETSAREELATLGELVEVWTRLRTDRASELREWRDQKEFLLAERDLLRDEAARLREEVESFEQMRDEAVAERESALSRQVELERDLLNLDPVLDELESALRREVEKLPAGLRPGLAPALDPLTRPESARTVDRLQRLMAALVALEELHPQVLRVRERIEIGDRRREADVLYLGLARGFATRADGDWAAVGVPGPDGWVWEERPEWRSAIQRLFAMADMETPGEFLHIPLRVEETP